MKTLLRFLGGPAVFILILQLVPPVQRKSKSTTPRSMVLSFLWSASSIPASSSRKGPLPALAKAGARLPDAGNLAGRPGTEKP